MPCLLPLVNSFLKSNHILITETLFSLFMLRMDKKKPNRIFTMLAAIILIKLRAIYQSKFITISD